MRKKTAKNKDLKKLSDKVWQYVNEDVCDMIWADIFDYRTSKTIKRIEKKIDKDKDYEFFNK